ncbi:MAG: zinc ABC transporter substrate-binding protein [Candidatus Omnitrophica bacterium]|nr:zinc ABC transporter substrate-binding protein [Candidatus Omnitrophota bacterium]
MKNIFKKYLLLGCAVLCAAFAAVCVRPSDASAAAPLKVAATSTLFADLTERIGGDRVKVTAIASPRSNVHFYQPTPRDIRTVRNADLYVQWGLDIEAWSDPLLEAAGKPSLFRKGSGNVDLSAGVPLLNMPSGSVSRAEGDIHLFGNPHFHMSPDNIRIMAGTLADRFKQADPEGSSAYDRNLKNFLERLDSKMLEWKDLCSSCAGKEIIAYHDDTAYLTEFLGVKLEEYVEVKPGIPATPQHLEYLQNYAEKHQVRAVTISTYYPKNAAKGLAGKIGVPLVTLAQNAGEVPGTETVFGFFDYNINQIAGALKA